MTSPINENIMIKINIRNTIKYQKKLKENRWNGYDIQILKDCKDTMQRLQEILLKRKIHKDMTLNYWRQIC